MDLQEMLTNKVSVMRQEKLKTMDILTVGELIAKLEPIVSKQNEVIKKYDHEASVSYDFEYLIPTEYDSWRGVYAELALGFKEPKYPESLGVTEFLNMTKEVVGKEFTGYKGGEFTMGKTTPIWVANYGNSGRTGLVDILDEEYDIVLITKYFKD